MIPFILIALFIIIETQSQKISWAYLHAPVVSDPLEAHIGVFTMHPNKKYENVSETIMYGKNILVVWRSDKANA
jgi:hypothetical protein